MLYKLTCKIRRMAFVAKLQNFAWLVVELTRHVPCKVTYKKLLHSDTTRGSVIFLGQWIELRDKGNSHIIHDICLIASCITVATFSKAPLPFVLGCWRMHLLFPPPGDQSQETSKLDFMVIGWLKVSGYYFCLRHMEGRGIIWATPSRNVESISKTIQELQSILRRPIHWA